MKTPRFVLTLASLACLAGCATSTTARLDRVQGGMSRQEVVALLGAPHGQRERDNTEYLTYYLASAKSAPEYPYMIKLVDARVEAVGRFVQLADLEAFGPLPPRVGMGAIIPTRMMPDPATQIRLLAAMRDRGEISEAEYLKARGEILTQK